MVTLPPSEWLNNCLETAGRISTTDQEKGLELGVAKQLFGDCGESNLFWLAISLLLGVAKQLFGDCGEAAGNLIGEK